MFIKLRNVKIDKCGTGIKSEGPILIDADELHITNTKTAFDLATTEDLSRDSSNTGARGNKQKRRDDIANNVIATLISATALSAIGVLWNLT